MHRRREGRNYEGFVLNTDEVQILLKNCNKYRWFKILPTIAQLSNTIIMFRHLKCHPQVAHCALLKLHTDFLVLVKESC
jgi:hypothetical protein